MKTLTAIFLIHILFFSLLQSNISYAGPYTDDLSKCIVESTTTSDRTAMVKWMFSAISFHPAVKPISSVSQQELEEANRQVAELFMSLLTESCKQQARKAIKYEGEIAIQTSFHILGQVASQEMFANPDVAAGVSGLEKYIDTDKLESSLGIK